MVNKGSLDFIKHVAVSVDLEQGSQLHCFKQACGFPEEASVATVRVTATHR